MTDVVRLHLPAQAELLILPRLVAAAVAARAELDVDEIEDLRLAVDELCLSVMGQTGQGGELSLELTRESGAVQISCAFTPAATEQDGAGPAGAEIPELSSRILDALVDEHSYQGEDTPRRAWLRKVSSVGRAP